MVCFMHCVGHQDCPAPFFVNALSCCQFQRSILKRFVVVCTHMERGRGGCRAVVTIVRTVLLSAVSNASADEPPRAPEARLLLQRRRLLSAPKSARGSTSPARRLHRSRRTGAEGAGAARRSPERLTIRRSPSPSAKKVLARFIGRMMLTVRQDEGLYCWHQTCRAH